MDLVPYDFCLPLQSHTLPVSVLCCIPDCVLHQQLTLPSGFRLGVGAWKEIRRKEQSEGGVFIPLALSILTAFGWLYYFLEPPSPYLFKPWCSNSFHGNQV